MQNLLNGWTGLNKNHVVFFPGSTTQSLGKSGNTNATPNSKSEPKSSLVLKPDHKFGKIKRTNSFSDLIKEKAIRKALTRKENHGDEPDKKIEPATITPRGISDASIAKSYARSQSDVSNSISNSQSQTNSNSTQKRDNSVAVRRGSLDSASIPSSSIPHNTGQYINENAYANQQRSMKFAERSSSQRSIGSSRKASSQHSKDGRVVLDTSDDGQHSDLSSLDGSHVESHSFHNHSIPYRSSNPPVIPEFQGSDGEMIQQAFTVSGSTCTQCQDAQKRLLATESDLEYLRSILINSEYVCISCEQRNQMHSGSSVASKHSTKSKQSMASGKISVGNSSGTSKRKGKHAADSLSLPENMTLAASSQRLMDTMIRHKRQIEQISKDTSRWQNDMHMKLSKLAMMCKDLNDESASRKEQVELARNDRDAIRQERNAMTSELELLRTRVQMYEKQEVEHAELRRIVREKQYETLAIADNAIAHRDSIIEQLTSRLNEALGIINDEKQNRHAAA